VKTSDQIVEIGRRTLKMESDALLLTADRLGQSFVGVVEKIIQGKGRIVVSGIGKSALVGQKIVATFNSTGTPAVFMHAADAIHGDLGIIQEQDIVICLSNSGNTAEIKVLAPLVKNLGNTLIAITGNADSFLAGQADFVLDSFVEQEACSINLAPTSSTTVQMAIGDALASALMECRGFKPEQFAQFHPGGSLGKLLYLKVSDIIDKQEFPWISVDSSLAQVVIAITTGRKGAVAVLDQQSLKGIITDGDLRRFLGSGRLEKQGISAQNLVSHSPKTISDTSLAVEALNLMKANKINQLIVLDGEKPVGILHIQEILSQGII
jgi:arabinose-5-phosphate isomerase